jgi:uncharacterized damage-inducible protein DinB
MITADYVRTMASYNAEMNRRWYAAAAGLTDEQRKAPAGAFWGSLHGTLNHILWGDQIWMSRFAGWPRPAVNQKRSPMLHDDFGELTAARVKMDVDLIAWAEAVDQAWLADDLVWFSGSTQREQRRPRGILVVHMFNHQTHHRGQAHALLTELGQDTGDTDLPFVL